MDKKVTITHITRELKITPATLSKALNNHPKISKETKKLVQSVALKLNYRVNRMASSLRSGKSNVIGSPSLSTIDQQTIRMGKEAFKLLLSLINEKNVTERIKIKVVLDAVPIFRESSKRLNTM